MLLVIFSVVFTFNSVAQDTNQNIINEDYLLIVKVEVETLTLSTELFIYSYEGVTLIPLQPLFDALRFAINVNPETEQAQGWFIKQENTFSLEIDTLYIAGKKYEIDDSCSIQNDGFDLYAPISCINKWFSINASLSFQDLTLKVASNETLPLIGQLKREKNRKQPSSKKRSQDIDPAAIIPNQYDWLGTPVIDAGFGYQENDVNKRYDYRLYSAFDFLGFETRLTTSQIEDSTQSATLTFHKKPATQNEVFILGMNDVSIGDVYGVSNDLISNGVGGAGIRLSANTDNQTSGFSSRIIEGYAPPNWEVELYRNNIQVDFLKVGQDGRYRFEQVDVGYGENIFDIKLYGPLGEIEIRRESINVGSSMLKHKTLTWSASFYDQSNNLLGFSDPPTLSNPYVNNSLSVRYGLFERLSLGISYFKHNFENDQPDHPEAYSTLTVLTALPMMNVSAEMAQDDQDGRGYNLGFQGKLFNYPTTLNIKHFDNLISDRNSHSQFTQYKVSSVGNFQIWQNNIQHGMKILHENINNSSENIDVENRMSFQMASGLLTNQNNYRISSSTDDAFFGYIKYTSRSGSKYKFRLQGDYKINPTSSIENVNINVRTVINPRIIMTMDAVHNPSDTKSTQLGLTYSQLLSSFKINLTGQWYESGDYTASVSFNFSLSAAPLHWSNENQVDNGRAHLHAFLDENMNSVYDEGEPSLEGVTFKGNNAWKDLQTNDQGEVILPRLSTRSINKISVIGSTLPDPYWRAQNPDIYVYSHAGGNADVSYPVYQTLEVEGQLHWQRNKSLQPAAGVLLHLVGDDGEVHNEIYSEFDGVYVFTGVNPGEYRLVIPKDVQDALNIQWNKDIIISASADQSLIYVEDIIIQR
ncbi:hypothetical protein [Oceaniserpentilla sp. 4NH20-0058]|uniref:hypothetical protein n=1 Tax=Oceaniserpentilla sp. 4NH20-0058 TaxID=3127660 RepID=UPI00333E29BB